MKKTPKRIILIAGATASGKSSLAMQVAEQLGGVIINADALQVYEPLRIVTARPSAADEKKIAHRLYGHIAAEQVYSVANWLNDIESVFDELAKADKTAIVVGGTGLYFKALQQGLADVPEIPQDVREKWRKRLEIHGPAVLHEELCRRDRQEGERISAGDSQRLVRALEVLDATGQSLTSFYDQNSGGLLRGADVTRVALMPPRDEVYHHAEARLDKMVADGAVDEVAALLALGLDDELPVMKAIGVRSFGKHIKGELSLEEALELAKRETRNFVKRQMTWVRGQMADWPHAATLEEAMGQ